MIIRAYQPVSAPRRAPPARTKKPSFFPGDSTLSSSSTHPPHIFLSFTLSQLQVIQNEQRKGTLTQLLSPRLQFDISILRPPLHPTLSLHLARLVSQARNLNQLTHCANRFASPTLVASTPAASVRISPSSITCPLEDADTSFQSSTSSRRAMRLFASVSHMSRGINSIFNFKMLIVTVQWPMLAKRVWHPISI